MWRSKEKYNELQENMRITLSRLNSIEKSILSSQDKIARLECPHKNVGIKSEFQPDSYPSPFGLSGSPLFRIEGKYVYKKRCPDCGKNFGEVTKKEYYEFKKEKAEKDFAEAELFLGDKKKKK